MKILIGDDSELVRSRVKSNLESLPYDLDIKETENLDETVAECHRFQPDLIVLDFSIHGGEGLATLGTLKSLPHPPVVVILTNFFNAEYKKAFLQAGADYFFDKSLEFDNVGQVVCTLLEQR